jgi:enoyl-CoA hydratase/carnithine racemase
LRASKGWTIRTSTPPSQLPSSSMPEILVDRNDGLVTVTLNRPDRLNAITNEMWVELARVFREVSHRKEDRALVITGAGTAFCSGADLSGVGSPDRSALEHMRMIGEAALALHRTPKPTVARIDGIAAGAGLNLALGCDLIVASDRSRFSEIFARRGLSVDFGGSWLLPRLIGLHKAKELVLLADVLSASEAAAMGLVNRVVTPDQLDAAVTEWVDRLMAGPPIALSLSKMLLNKSFESSMDQALEAEAQAQAVNSASADAREARSAFLEKREPRFEGR